MLKQFDVETDANLNELEEHLASVLAQLDSSERMKDTLWQHIFEIFDSQRGANSNARFICEDEMVLAREVAKSKATVDAEKLHDALFHVFPKAEAQRMWNKITVPTRVLDQGKLAKAVESNYLPALLLDQAVTPERETIRRVRKPMAKADREMLAMAEEEAAERKEADAGA